MADVACDVAGLEAAQLPERCVCCCGPADDVVEVAVTPPDSTQAVDLAVGGSSHGQSIEVPCCAGCLQHRAGESKAWIYAVIPGGLVTLVLLVVGGFPAMPAGRTFVFFMLGAVVTAIARYTVFARMEAGRSKSCAPSAVAVACMGPLSGDRYRFHFANPVYGREFVKLNRPPPAARRP